MLIVFWKARRPRLPLNGRQNLLDLFQHLSFLNSLLPKGFYDVFGVLLDLFWRAAANLHFSQLPESLEAFISEQKRFFLEHM